MALIREGKRKARPRGNTVVRPGDTLLLKGGQEALEDFIDAARMKLVRGDRPVLLEEAKDEVHLVEAVIGADSPLTGQSVRQLDLYGQHGLNLLGVSRSGYELTQHLRTAKLQSGDVPAAAGLRIQPAGPVGRTEAAAPGRARSAAGRRAPQIPAGRGPGRRHGDGRLRRDPGVHRLLRRGRGDRGPGRTEDARGLCGAGRAPAGAYRRADPRVGRHPADRRGRPDRQRPARPVRGHPAGGGGGGNDAGVDGGDAVP